MVPTGHLLLQLLLLLLYPEVCPVVCTIQNGSTDLQCTKPLEWCGASRGESVDACIDSSGNFYCTTLWYFWFGLFWFCMFIFVGVMCIVNRYNKKKSQVDVDQWPLPTQRAIQNPNNHNSRSGAESSA